MTPTDLTQYLQNLFWVVTGGLGVVLLSFMTVLIAARGYQFVRRIVKEVRETPDRPDSKRF